MNDMHISILLVTFLLSRKCIMGEDVTTPIDDFPTLKELVDKIYDIKDCTSSEKWCSTMHQLCDDMLNILMQPRMEVGAERTNAILACIEVSYCEEKWTETDPDGKDYLRETYLKQINNILKTKEVQDQKDEVALRVNKTQWEEDHCQTAGEDTPIDGFPKLKDLVEKIFDIKECTSSEKWCSTMSQILDILMQPPPIKLRMQPPPKPKIGCMEASECEQMWDSDSSSNKTNVKSKYLEQINTLLKPKEIQDSKEMIDDKLTESTNWEEDLCTTDTALETNYITEDTNSTSIGLKTNTISTIHQQVEESTTQFTSPATLNLQTNGTSAITTIENTTQGLTNDTREPQRETTTEVPTTNSELRNITLESTETQTKRDIDFVCEPLAQAPQNETERQWYWEVYSRLGFYNEKMLEREINDMMSQILFHKDRDMNPRDKCCRVYQICWEIGRLVGKKKGREAEYCLGPDRCLWLWEGGEVTTLEEEIIGGYAKMLFSLNANVIKNIKRFISTVDYGTSLV